ncbi:hypothetical protein LXA43DRAFT_1097463 [Ganoderma leucocontextum]|nr:hypothetical protein LXA43DRAFT_1097463 [Ganoderma leucocontextum]
MSAIMTIALDYSENDDFDANTVPLPDPKWLRVTVEGERAITQMYLPTGALETLEDAYWGTWIATIQGPVMGRCDVTPTQRQLLLDIALTYRAFTSGTAGVADIWYTNFIRTLINIARSHVETQSIDKPLTNLTSALRVLLLPAIFSAPDIPPVTDDPPPPSPQAEAASASGPSGSGGSAGAPADTASSHTPAEPVHSLDDIYSAVRRRTVDEGYDSDEDTMPSLHSVLGSSDDDDD